MIYQLIAKVVLIFLIMIQIANIAKKVIMGNNATRPVMKDVIQLIKIVIKKMLNVINVNFHIMVKNVNINLIKHIA
jgi:hypothetical protein